MPLCSHFCPGSILLPFLGTSNKPELPCTHSQAGAGWSPELCLGLDLLGSSLRASSPPPPHSGPR